MLFPIIQTKILSQKRNKAHLYAINIKAWVQPSFSEKETPALQEKQPAVQRTSGQHNPLYSA